MTTVTRTTPSSYTAAVSTSSVDSPSPFPAIFARAVPLVGVPVALLLDALLVAAFGRAHGYLSVAHALQLALFVPTVALAVGGIVGAALARRRLPPDDEAAVRAAAAREAAAAGLPPALVAHIRHLGQHDPARLAREGRRLALVGYGYALVVGGGLLASAALMKWLEHREWMAGIAFWACFWLGLSVLLPLVVRWQAPGGEPLGARQAAGLRALVHDAARHAGAPVPDEIVIDLDFNAKASVRPRLGIVGPARRSLVIGLPLLEALPQDELRALLAHEMAHHGRGHLRRVQQIVRVRNAWTGMLLSLEVLPSWGTMLLRPFARWYVPRLALYADALSRQDEHDADRVGAGTGQRVMGRLLLRMAVWQRFLAETVMPDIRRPSAARDEPEPDALDRLLDAMRRGPSPDETRRLLVEVLAERTLDESSHPSPGDRMAAIGELPPASDSEIDRWVAELCAPEPRAGELLAGSGLRRRIASTWEAAITPEWRTWVADARTWQAAGDLPPDQWPEPAVRARARWAVDCLAPDEAEPEVRALLARAPDDVEGTALLGALLLERPGREREGQQALEVVLGTESVSGVEAALRLLAWYERLGLPDEAERVRRRRDTLQLRMARAAVERTRLRVDDELVAHGLAATTLEQVSKACARERRIGRAWVVRKRSRVFRDEPLVVIAVQGSLPRYRMDDIVEVVQAAAQRLLQRIQLPARAEVLVAPVPRRGAITRRLQAMPGALVYERPS